MIVPCVAVAVDDVGQVRREPRSSTSHERPESRKKIYSFEGKFQNIIVCDAAEKA